MLKWNNNIKHKKIKPRFNKRPLELCLLLSNQPVLPMLL